MANLEDYGIRIINHGSWSDPEVEWKKSDYQTVLFNYWDCIECFENNDFDLFNEDDLETFVQYLSELTPSEYKCPKIDYEWKVNWHDEDYDCYSADDSDFYKEHGMSPKEDFVLHNSSQALRQALQYIDEERLTNCEIEVFRRSSCKREKVAAYILQGSTLRDIMRYKKCA